MSKRPDDLRRRAEEKLRATGENIDRMSEKDMREVFHEFRVHQAELEIQNDNLRATQEELEQARDRYSALYHSAPVGFITLDGDKRVVEANRTAGNLLGIDQSRLIDKTFTDFVEPDHQDAFYLFCQQILANETVDAVELTLERADGTPFDARIQAISNPRGLDIETCFYLSLMDISAEKESERRARERMLEIESIYRYAPLGFCVLDRDLRFVRINERLAEINGASIPDHIGKTLREVVPDIVDKVEPIMELVLSSGQPAFNMEVSGETPSQPGVTRHWMEHWLPLLDEHRNIVGINCVVEEITERQKLEDDLQELNTNLEKLVRERTAEAEARAVKLEQLARQLTQAENRERSRFAQMMHDSLQQLLVASKRKAERIAKRTEKDDLKKPLTDLIEMLGQCCDETRSLTVEICPPMLYTSGFQAALQWLANWMEKTHELKVEVGSEEVKIADPDLSGLLFQIVRELLFNVVKHAETTHARVRSMQLADKLYIDVEDGGKGFDTELLGKQSEAEGGFGLFSVIERLRIIGGDVKIESGIGRGTKIGITVPLAVTENSIEITADTVTMDAAAAEALLHRAAKSREKSERRGEGPIRILLADDHDLVREAIASVLDDQSGLEVVGEAVDGQSAISMAHEFDPDVILMDVTMPGIGGIEATRRIARELPHIRILGLSVHKDKEISDEMIRAGAERFLSKDCSSEELLAAIYGREE